MTTQLVRRFEMEFESPPQLPPKGGKQIRKSLQDNDETSTLPSTAVLKQNIFIRNDSRNSLKSDSGTKTINNKKNDFDAPKILKCTFKPIENPCDHEPVEKVNIRERSKKFEVQKPEQKVTIPKTQFTDTLAKFNTQSKRVACFDSRNDLKRKENIKKNGVVEKMASAFKEPTIKKRGNKETTWAQTKNTKPMFTIKDWSGNDDLFLYQNVSTNGTNYIEYALNEIQKESKKTSWKDYQKNKPYYEDINFTTSDHKKTSQIEVQQIKNKTVVKISMNEYQEPDKLFNRQPEVKYNEYAEPFANKPEVKKPTMVGDYQQPGQVYANVDRSKKKNRKIIEDEQVYENTDIKANIYQNSTIEDVDNDEKFYANLEFGEKPKQEPLDYANVNVSDGDEYESSYYENLEDEDNQVYENQEFEILKNSKVTQSVIEKNPAPIAKLGDLTKKPVLKPITTWSPGRRNKDDDDDERGQIYENTEVCQGKERGIIKPVPINPKQTVKMSKSSEYLQENRRTSPSETLDSGTGSDREHSPIPPKTQNGKVIVTIGSYQPGKKEEIATGTTTAATTSTTDKAQAITNVLTHKRAESITSSGVDVDSDAEGSNISCDSLNSNELNGLSTAEDHGYHTPTSENKTGSPTEEYQNIDVIQENITNKNTYEEDDDYENTDIIKRVELASRRIKNLRYDNGIYQAKRIEPSDVYENYSLEEAGKDDEDVKSLPKGLLQDIRSRNVRLSATYPKGEKDENEVAKSSLISKTIKSFDKKSNKENKKKKEKEKKIEKQKHQEQKIEDQRLTIDQRTYEERKVVVDVVRCETKICAMDIDTDQFYKFHLFENTNVCEDKSSVVDESFAGYKDYLNVDKNSAIKSSKGTIRGVKNRVRAGIATFLQIHDKTYKDKDSGKIVVYSTTMGIVRETYHKCLKVKQILKTLMVKFEERDVFMSTIAQEEIRDRMKCDAILIPQVFVEGQHIGDAETIERLNESGELRMILKPYKSSDACSTCQVCGGYRLLPCQICKGSKKSVHRNHFTTDFVSLKCMNCDPVGLVKCYAC